VQLGESPLPPPLDESGPSLPCRPLPLIDMEQKLKQGKHLSFTAHVSNRKTLALLDNGSDADFSHARKLNLPVVRLQKPIPLHLRFYRELTEAALIDLHVGDHSEYYLTHIPRYQMILGGLSRAGFTLITPRLTGTGLTGQSPSVHHSVSKKDAFLER
jgi:hypothetical protein